MKTSVSRNECGNSKAEVEPNSAANKKASENNSKLSEPPKQDYIHVRARRGQEKKLGGKKKGEIFASLEREMDYSE